MDPKKGITGIKQIEGELGKLPNAVEQAGNKMKSSWQKIEGGIASLGNKMKSFMTGLPAMMGFTGFAAAIIDVTKAAMEDEVQFARLKSAIELAGVSYDSVKGKIEAYSQQVMATTQFGEDEFIPALQEIIQLSGNVKGAFEGTNIALAMAKSGLFDVGTASRYVGMAMAGEVEMLGRYIPKLRASNGLIKENMTAEEKWAAAKTLLIQKFGESAAGVTTFSAKVQQLKNHIDKVSEGIGKIIMHKFGPTIEDWTKEIQTFIKNGEMERWITNIAIAFENVLDGLITVWNAVKIVGTVFNAWFSSTFTQLNALGRMLNGVMTLRPSEIKAAWDEFIKAPRDAIATTEKVWNTSIANIQNAWLTAKRNIEADKVKIEADQAKAKAEGAAAGANFKAGFQGATMDLAPNWGGPRGAGKSKEGGMSVENAPPVEDIGTAAERAAQQASETWQIAWEDIGTGGQATGSAIMNAFSSVGSVLSNEFNTLWEKIFGKAKSTFQKVAQVFMSSMFDALAQIAARAAALWILTLIFPQVKAGVAATGGIWANAMRHEGGMVMHGGGYMHAGGLRPDERRVIMQTGEFVTQRSSVNSFTLPTLSYINRTGRAPAPSINISGDTVQVDGILDSRTVLDLKRLIADNKTGLAEQVEDLLQSRRLKVA